LPARFFIWSGVSYGNRPLFFTAAPIQTGSITVTVFHLVRRELSEWTAIFYGNADSNGINCLHGFSFGQA
jgi:hypothetical protein